MPIMDANAHETVDLIVRNANIVTQNEQRDVMAGGAIAIHDGQIIALADDAVIASHYSAPTTIDARGNPVFPGFVNTHTHLFQASVKGLGESLALGEWLRQVTFPTSMAINAGEIYLLSLVSCIDNLRSGATTINEFSYPLADPLLHDATIRAIHDSGLRGRYSRGIVDAGERFGVTAAHIAPVELCIAHIRALRAAHQHARSLLDVGIALGIIWGMSEHGLRAVRAAADATGMRITMHVNEVQYDNECALAAWGMATVPMLEHTGLLGADFLPVHCVHMTDQDIALFARHNVPVSYNAISNMILGSGIAPIAAMMRAGINICIATDGAGSNNSNDMLESLKFSALLQRAACQDASVVSAQTALDWATRNGAQAMGMLDRVGSLEAGKRADLFIFNPNTPKATPMHDPVATLVHSSSQANISTVIVDGRVLVDNGRLTQVDEPALLRDAQLAATALAKRCGTLALHPTQRPRHAKQ